MYYTFTVCFSSTFLSVSTTINLESESTDMEELEEQVIDLASERIDSELGVCYTDTCHSVHVEPF